MLLRLHQGSAGGLINALLGLDAAGTQDLQALFQPTTNAGWNRLSLDRALALIFPIGVAGTTQRILEIAWDRPRLRWQRRWWRRPVRVLAFIGHQRRGGGPVPPERGARRASRVRAAWWIGTPR